MFSLIGTAKLNGLDSEAHLRHLIERVASTPISRAEELLPSKSLTPCGAATTRSIPPPEAPTPASQRRSPHVLCGGLRRPS